MTEPIRVRIRLEGGVADVRVLIGHPMETGLRKDPRTGETVPLHFIQSVTATLNGKPVMEAQWSRAVARNPYLQFRVGGAHAGDELGIAWRDSRGDSGSAKTRLQAAE
jgi:sulfur-oxidizing protein SoxZ